MTPPGGDDSRRGRRQQTRQHLAELFADIPPKRRAQFMRRASDVLAKILEESEPDDTRYDDKGRMVRLGTSKRDRAAIVKDALSSFKMLGEISRDATEQHIAVTKLLHGILSPQQPTAPTIQIVMPSGTAVVPTASTLHNDTASKDSPQSPTGSSLPGDPDE